MIAKLLKKSSKEIIIEVTVKLSDHMLESEEQLQQSLNAAGNLATGELLSRFDTDGSPIIVGDIKLTSKGQEEKVYQTPYGAVSIDRYVYQSSRGGTTYCPLENNARIIKTSTPKFAKMISSKYAEGSSVFVERDLEENHGRAVARSFIKNISEEVGAIVEAKEEGWHYSVPELDGAVKTVSIGLDGTCMLMCEEGWRVAMVGTLALYNKAGERMHTVYTAASPEYGKEKFTEHFEREIELMKEKFPKAHYIGLADGAKDNWSYLKEHTDTQTLDFWHATEYLAKASKIMFRGKRKTQERNEWLENSCHKLKHKKGAATRLLNEMIDYESSFKLSGRARDDLVSSITYFKNNRSKMKYSDNVASNLPIGSGVTEAACKVIVKQRLGGSGMKWKDKGASMVLHLRSLVKSSGRWTQFWSKVSQYGTTIS